MYCNTSQVNSSHISTYATELVSSESLSDSSASSFDPTLGSKSDLYFASKTVLFAASESATDSLNIEIEVILMYFFLYFYLGRNPQHYRPGRNQKQCPLPPRNTTVGGTGTKHLQLAGQQYIHFLPRLLIASGRLSPPPCSPEA